MSISPVFRLSYDFAELFGRQLEGVGLVKAAAPMTDDARGLAVNNADCVAADEQQDDDNT